MLIVSEDAGIGRLTHPTSQIRSTTIISKLGEEIKSTKKKLVELESKSGNEDLLKGLLEKKNKEVAQLQVCI